MMRPPGLVALLILIAAPAPVSAEDAQRPEIVGVRVGLAGRYKPGLWTPVEVELRGTDRLEGPRVTVTVPDGDRVPSRVSAPLPSLDAAAATENEAAADGRSVLLYARLGRVKSELAVELSSAGVVVQHRVFQSGKDSDFRRALLSDQELVVTVGRAPLGVEEAARLLHQDPEEKTVVVRLDDVRQLPTQWYGYEGVGTVVLSTSDPQIYADLRPAGPRVSALDEWIRMGGRLILSAGERAGEVLGREPEGPLARFAPGRFEKTVPLRQAGAFEAYCGSSAQIRVPTAGIRVPYLADVQGIVEAREGALPLVVRRAWGFGQIVFIAVDLDRPALAGWEDRGRLVRMLLDQAESSVEEDDETTAIMHYGFTDLAGQLRSALDHFPRVPPVSFWLVAGLIIVYILAIGPGDYFLLRKVVRRMPWTWVTFPLIVVTFGLLAYVLAVGLKGDRVRLNQIDLVDVDLETGRLRGTAWANVFSPRMQRYDLAFRPKPGGRAGGPTAAPIAWLGLPGDALGGMNPRTLEPKIWGHHYDFSGPLDEMRGVPIPVGSTKSLTARWTAQVVPAVKAGLARVDRFPEGTITNTLPFPLTECRLAFGKYAYELGTIGSGETVQVGPHLDLRELRSLLTEVRFVRDGEKESYRPQVTPYNRGSVDAAYVLQAMMFYEESDGRPYTGLSNRYQGFVDLSHLLKTGRAVLIGRAQAGTGGPPPYAAELLLNGQTLPPPQVRHTTLYRFVIPVEPEGERLAADE